MKNADEIELKENSIEEIVCKPFDSLKRQPMSDDLTRLMINLAFGKIREDIKEEEWPFIVKVIRKRISLHSFEINDMRVIFFLSQLCNGSLGIAVLYIWYLNYWCKLHDATEVTFDNFTMQIFPFGFPSDADLRRLWDAQKINMLPDNLVDHYEFGKSLTKSMDFT